MRYPPSIKNQIGTLGCNISIIHDFPYNAMYPKKESDVRDIKKLVLDHSREWYTKVFVANLHSEKQSYWINLIKEDFDILSITEIPAAHDPSTTTMIVFK